MATKNTTTTATATATKGKAAPAPAPVAAPQAPQAPRFTFATYNAATGQGWPAKAASGNSIRAYCAQVAQQLAKVNPQGFTVAQYAQALVANANGTSYKQPAQGWGHGKAGSNAMQHASYFAKPAIAYLVPAN